MFKENKAIVTSTPKQPQATETTVLREKKWNNIMNKQEDENVKQIKKKSFPKKNGGRSNGNFRRKKRNRSQVEEHDENIIEKRRQQAIEAMKIAEQRRLRLQMAKNEDKNDVDKLDESFQKIALESNCDTNNEYLPDGRLKLSKQQLMARRLKHERIKRHLIAQEAKKRESSLKFICKPSFSTSPVYRIPLSYRARENSYYPYAQKVSASIIRYSKDELRAMNPYGYYFM